MACLDNIVGIDNKCTPDTPTSGLFLNSIGISIRELEAIVTEDYEDAIDFANQKIDFATQQIVNQIGVNFADRYRTNTILDGQRLGYTSTNLNTEAGEAGVLKGIELELCNSTSYLDVFLSSISLHLNHTGNVNVVVWDLLQNKLLDTIVVAAVSGCDVQVDINKTYKSDRKRLHLFIGYDTTGIQAVKTVIKESGCSTCNATSFTSVNNHIRARGSKVNNAATKIDKNVFGVGNTSGLGFTYAIECNHEDWLCTIRNLLGLPILYKAGAEIMEFASLNSTRLNEKTLIDLDKLEDRMVKYGMQYEESFQNVLKRIKLPKDVRCFECNPRAQMTTSLP